MEVLMQLGTLLRSISFLELANSMRAIRFAIQRDQLDRRYKRTIHEGNLVPQLPGSLKWTREIPHGAELHFEHAILELLFLAPDVIRLTWRPGELPIPYAIVGNEWPGDQVHLGQDQHGLTLTGSQLTLEVGTDGATTILGTAGALLRSEDPPILTGESWEQKSQLDPLACVFGLGERASGWNLRSGSYQLWNQDPGGSYGHGHDPLYMSIPVHLCVQPQGNYLLFYENPYRGEIAFDDDALVRFERGALRSYFFRGSPEACLDRYTQLTGRPPMPPRWSLGYHQSRWGYQSQDEIRDLADRFKEHNLPISVIHLDIDYMDGYRVFTFKESHFGQVDRLSQDLQTDGINLVTIIDPGVKVDRGYAVFREGLSKGMFCTLPNGRPMLSIVWPGWVYFPDYTNPEVRSWWGNYYQQLLDRGIAGIWHDMNEPTAFAPWGDKTFPLFTQHAFENQGGDHLGAHNLYALLMNRAGFEALQKFRPEQRPWLLSRAGFAGGQRYAWNWTGDVETSWEALRQTLATMLGVSLSGFAYTGSDIGGFSGTPDPELYLRWFQLGAFSPFFRTHSAIGTPPREPWTFEETILDAVRTLLQMRYRLMPYFYTLAWVAHQKGTPLLRPVLWIDPEDPSLWEISDQFFLGPAILVAPVLTAGSLEREVQFPGGSWYDLWDGTRYDGPGARTVSAEITHIPAFVRGGTILPMEISETKLELHIYLPNEGSLEGELYSDAGDGYHTYRVDRFTGSRHGNKLELSRTTVGEYPWPYTSLLLVLHGAEMVSMKIDGDGQPIQKTQALISLFKDVDIKLV
jgi:alpha-glucosidase